MTMDTSVRCAFEKLKPICVELTKDCSIDRLNCLHQGCQDLDPISFQLLQEYLIFPIRLSLKRQTNQNIAIECIKFINFVFRKTKLQNWNFFADFIGQLFHFSNGPLHSTESRNVSEEMTKAVCDCTESILLCSSKTIHEKIYSYDFRLPLAQYLFVLLEILKKEVSRSLRLSALNAVSAFIYVHRDIEKESSVIVLAGDRLASFLPGISVTFHTILSGDVKQGHNIFKSALEIFGDFIVITLGDKYINKDSPEQQDGGANDDGGANVLRSLTWIKSIGDKLDLVIKKVTELISHEHWEVRLELAKFSGKLICSCPNNLPSCVPPLLQVLFVLSVDDYEEIRCSCQNYLTQFSVISNSVESISFLLEENIFDITSKLIKIHLSVNDTKKLNLLKMLHGYFEMFDASVNALLYSFPHLDRFLLSFLNLVKFDYSDQNFLSQHLPAPKLDRNFSELWPEKKFKYFDDKEIASRISTICYILGCKGDIQILVDYLLEKHQTGYTNEALYLITVILKGQCPDSYELDVFLDKDDNRKIDRSIADHVVNMLVDYLMSLDIWRFSFNGSDGTNSDSPEKQKEKIWHMCLVLECISVCSQILCKDFRVHLMSVLCPVMAKVGMNNLMISHTASLVLQCLAQSCRYNCVSHLVIDNVDYIINSITLNLNHFLDQPETVVVLRVTVDNTDISILPLVKDTIQRMLRTLDLHQEKALIIMKVLKSVVLAIKRWCAVSDTVSPKSQKKPHEENLAAAIAERHRLKTIANSFGDDKILNSDDDTLPDDTFVSNDHDILPDDDAMEEPMTKTPPVHVVLITNLLDHCVHMLSSRSLELTVLTLEIINGSIIALRNHNDDVLPYVHKIWSSLVSRFSGNVIVVMRAFETLVVIANECGDFVKSRTMKEVWPKLLAFLKSQMNISMSKRNASDYSITTGCKFQLLILSQIGDLAKKLDLTEKEFEGVVLSCLPYLRMDQPEILRRAAMKSLDCFAKIDADSFWFHFHEHCSTDKDISLPKNGPEKFRKIAFSITNYNDIGNYVPPLNY